MSVKTVTFSYFVICVDYGRDGREAIVDPEMTRRGAVEKVRELLGDGKEFVFIHHVKMNDAPSDVKDELIAEARLPEVEPEVIDMQAARFDRNRDLRKHEVVS